MRPLGRALLAIAVLGCGSPTPSPERPRTFIALGSDFAPFERWTTFARDDDPVPPTHPATRSVIYASRTPGPSEREFPVGTILVRIEQQGTDPTRWEVHAMAKRGGRYNAGGARGWEFFGLRLSARRQPFIEWRGEGPSGTSDGYSLDDGGTLFGCNHCHGAVAHNDSVLSPVLELRR